jgi:hypothetical protein
MSRFVGIKLSEEEYERYKRMARIENKSLSKFIRDKLSEAVMAEVKEVNLLNRLIKLLESLPSRLQVQGGGQVVGEEFNQLARLLVYIIKLLELQSEYTIVMEVKRREFNERREQLRRELGVEV